MPSLKHSCSSSPSHPFIRNVNLHIQSVISAEFCRSQTSTPDSSGSMAVRLTSERSNWLRRLGNGAYTPTKNFRHQKMGNSGSNQKTWLTFTGSTSAIPSHRCNIGLHPWISRKVPLGQLSAPSTLLLLVHFQWCSIRFRLHWGQKWLVSFPWSRWTLSPYIRDFSR